MRNFLEQLRDTLVETGELKENSLFIIGINAVLRTEDSDEEIMQCISDVRAIIKEGNCKTGCEGIIEWVDSKVFEYLTNVNNICLN